MKKGFTLVELLIYMAILSTLFISTLFVISTIYTSINRQNKNTEMNKELLFFHSFMETLIYNGTVTVPVIGFGNDTMTLQFNNLPISHVINIYYKNNTIFLKRTGGVEIPLDLPHLKFTQLSFKNLMSSSSLATQLIQIIFSIGTSSQEFDILTT